MTDDEAVEAAVALRQYRAWIATRGCTAWLSADGARYAAAVIKNIPPVPTTTRQG